MKDSARYRKIVEWSEEDRCFVGSAPDLMMGGCHGSDERAVFDELCQIVEEWIEMYKKEGKPLPPASRPRTDARALKAFTDAQPTTDHKLLDRFKRGGRP